MFIYLFQKQLYSEQKMSNINRWLSYASKSDVLLYVYEFILKRAKEMWKEL